MTISAGLWDAKTRLSQYVDGVVNHGQRVLITRNGKPVAALVSAEDLAALVSLESEQAATVRRSALTQALHHARVWNNRLLGTSGGQRLPNLDDVLREARQDAE
jgi:prevent-host-death family protein